MKTIRQWLEELPEPYRTEAINNYIEKDNEMYGLYDRLFALEAAFDWAETPQGFDYWNFVFTRIRNNVPL